VPQNRNDAAEFIKLIGELNRSVGRIEADMNDKIALIKERYEKQAIPMAERARELTGGLQLWCAANREALTGGKVKSANLGTGEVEWRNLPPKVTIRDAENVLAQIEKLGLTAFARVKTEINKEAMLADADKARLLKGVTIGSAGEQFVVKPFEVELDGGKA